MSNPAAKSQTSPEMPILLRSDDRGVVLLTLNRPAARNSISAAMITAISRELGAIRLDKSVRAVVFSATGTVFSAGHDLKEMTAHRTDPDRGRQFYRDVFTACSEMMQSVVSLPVPAIAAVEGLATAAGCQLAASCDLVVASETARFATPGVNIGFYCSTPMVALSRKVSPGHAMEMLLTAEPVPASRAFEMGLVNRVVPAGRAVEEAMNFARVIASKSSYVQKLGKAAFYRQLELNLPDAYKFTIDVAVENMLARDAEEGIGAFVDKREPKWEDR